MPLFASSKQSATQVPASTQAASTQVTPPKKKSATKVRPIAVNTVKVLEEPDQIAKVKSHQLNIIIGDYETCWFVLVGFAKWNEEDEDALSVMQLAGRVYVNRTEANVLKQGEGRETPTAISCLALAGVIPPTSNDEGAKAKGIVGFDYALFDQIGLTAQIQQAITKIEPKAKHPCINESGEFDTGYIDYHTQNTSGIQTSALSGIATCNSRRVIVPQTPATVEVLSSMLLSGTVTNAEEAQGNALAYIQEQVDRIHADIKAKGNYKKASQTFTYQGTAYPLFAPPQRGGGDSEWAAIPQINVLDGGEVVIVLNQIQPSLNNEGAWTGNASNFLFCGNLEVRDTIGAPTPKADTELLAEFGVTFG